MQKTKKQQRDKEVKKKTAKRRQQRKKLKIAVYAISYNESKFVEPFMRSSKDADGVFVTDTGSTDDTVELLKNAGAKVQVKKVEWSDWPEKSRTEEWKERLGRPWRFDIARNWSIDFIPEDYDVCICLDMDEVLHPQWRKHLEAAWTPKTTRLRYRYIWNHLPDGSPDVEYYGDKIHHRRKYEWRHPVHEVLYCIKGPEIQSWSNLVIEHFADQTKSRRQYYPMLELAVEEDPTNDRNSHYLGREYFFVREYEKAKKELKRHLSLPKAGWRAERAASMRYLAKCCLFLKEPDEYFAWLRRACAEAPGEREPWLELSQAYFDNKEYLGGYFAAKQALKIIKRPPTYITSGFAWGERAYDLAGTCAFYVGLIKESRELSLRAYQLAPRDQRLISNVKFVERAGAPGYPPLKVTFHVLWPVEDLDKFGEAHRLWKERCSTQHNVRFHIVTRSMEEFDHDELKKAVYFDWPDRVSAIDLLCQDLEARPGDIIIATYDGVVPSEGWDKAIYDNTHHFAGCVLVGNQPDAEITVPVLDFGCFVRLDKSIFHPSYRGVQFAGKELYNNLEGLKLIRDLREKIPFECPDGFSGEYLGQDEENYKQRSTMDIKDKLQRP